MEVQHPPSPLPSNEQFSVSQTHGKSDLSGSHELNELLANHDLKIIFPESSRQTDMVDHISQEIFNVQEYTGDIDFAEKLTNPANFEDVNNTAIDVFGLGFDYGDLSDFDFSTTDDVLLDLDLAIDNPIDHNDLDLSYVQDFDLSELPAFDENALEQPQANEEKLSEQKDTSDPALDKKASEQPRSEKKPLEQEAMKGAISHVDHTAGAPITTESISKHEAISMFNAFMDNYSASIKNLETSPDLSTKFDVSRNKGDDISISLSKDFLRDQRVFVLSSDGKIDACLRSEIEGRTIKGFETEPGVFIVPKGLEFRNPKDFEGCAFKELSADDWESIHAEFIMKFIDSLQVDTTDNEREKKEEKLEGAGVAVQQNRGWSENRIRERKGDEKEKTEDIKFDDGKVKVDVQQKNIQAARTHVREQRKQEAERLEARSEEIKESITYYENIREIAKEEKLKKEKMGKET